MVVLHAPVAHISFSAVPNENPSTLDTEANVKVHESRPIITPESEFRTDQKPNAITYRYNVVTRCQTNTESTSSLEAVKGFIVCSFACLKTLDTTNSGTHTRSI
jgi:hypothetical protein